MDPSSRNTWTIAIFSARRFDIGHGGLPFADLPLIFRLRPLVDDTTSKQALLGE